MKKTNKKGFTLIELLAVIVIIAIIALIGIPSVTKIMSNSRRDAIKSTGLAMVKAAKTFIAGENVSPAGTDLATACYITWAELGMDSAKLSTGKNVATTATTGTPDLVGSKVFVHQTSAGSGVYVYTVDLIDESGNGFTAQTDDVLTGGGEALRGDISLEGGETGTTVSAQLPCGAI